MRLVLPILLIALAVGVLVARSEESSDRRPATPPPPASHLPTTPLDRTTGSSEAAVVESPLDPLALGKQIYTTGTRPSGEPIEVTISLPGAPPHRQSAEFSPCVGCHGEDGATSEEGGVRVPAIRLADLAAPHAAGNSTGRVHRPYDRALTSRAIRMGIDASGNPLHALMPRYDLSIEEADAVVTYLEHLGKIPEVGVSDDAVRIGCALPVESLAGEERAWAIAMRDTLRAYFTQVAADGGVFGRSIEWVESTDPTELAGCFAVLATDTVADRLDAETPIHRLPLSMRPPIAVEDLPAREFSLLAARPDLFRVAIDHVIDVLHLEGVSFLLLQSEGDTNEACARSVRDQAGRKLGAEVAELRVAAGDRAFPRALRSCLDGNGPLVVLVDPDLPDLAPTLELLVATDRVARIYVPGLVRGWDVGPSARALSEKLLSVSPLPLPDPRVAETEFADLCRSAELAPDARIPALVAYAWGCTLTEALRGCGRRVTRDRYVRGLESLRGFRPAPFAPLTLDASRRVAALGGQVVRWSLDDGRWIALAEWKEPR